MRHCHGFNISSYSPHTFGLDADVVHIRAAADEDSGCGADIGTVGSCGAVGIGGGSIEIEACGSTRERWVEGHIGVCLCWADSSGCSCTLRLGYLLCWQRVSVCTVNQSIGMDTRCDARERATVLSNI